MAAPSVPVNIFTGSLLGIIGFTITQVKILVDNGYEIQESFIYWKFTYIKDWYQFKSETHASRGGASYGDRNINCLQELDWWVIDLMLGGKMININNFNNDIISDAIEESWIDLNTQEMEKGI